VLALFVAWSVKNNGVAVFSPASCTQLTFRPSLRFRAASALKMKKSASPSAFVSICHSNDAGAFAWVCRSQVLVARASRKESLAEHTLGPSIRNVWTPA
jgi:hypothetical protein